MEKLVIALSICGGFITIVSFLAKIFEKVSKIEKSIMKSELSIERLEEKFNTEKDHNARHHETIFQKLAELERRIYVQVQ